MTPPRRAEVWGAAKVNIGWRVGSRREDGYHDVCGNLQSVSLFDRLEIERDEAGDGLRVLVPGHPELEDPANLVYAAGRALASRVEPVPTTVTLHKAIPVAAGLGGGSADAAAALAGLNALWGAGLDARRLVELAAEVGSDVPAMLVGGLVHVSGRGERVRGIGSFDDGFLVLGLGAERVSASAAYEAFDRLGTRDAAGLHHNDLEEAACGLVGGLSDRLEAMREAAGPAFVSGSGPTVVGVVADEQAAHAAARRVAGRFASVEIVRPVDHGVRLRIGPH